MKRHENGYIEPMCKNCPYDDKCDVGTHYCFQAIKEKYAEVEDKIEQGLMIELPCKVWDTVYMPWEFDGNCGIAILSVEEIEISRQSIFTNLESDDLVFLSKYNCGVFYFDEVGTKVFLTKAEAEAKLKELQGERE